MPDVRTRGLRFPCAFLALLLATGCSDVREPLGVTPGPGNDPDPGLTPLPALIVSDPSPGGQPASAYRSAGATGVVYVSLPPGSFPTADQVRIEARISGVSVAVLPVDGGFDPLPVVAPVGDTLDIFVHLAGDTAVLAFAKVVPERRPPVVVRTMPPPRRRDVPLNAPLIVIFSEPIDPGTVTTGTLRLLRAGVPVAGTLAIIDPAGLSASFTPALPLAPATDYALEVTQGIADLGGELLETAVTVPFTTADAPPGVPVGQIAFVRNGQIHLVNVDGSNLVRLTNGPADDDPAWSPDGQRIAFTSISGTGRHVYLMDADGSNIVQLTSGRSDASPTWSPDGTWIAYSGLHPASDSLNPGWGSADIYLVRTIPDGSSPVDITNQQGWEDQPAWSPDGARIAYVSDWTAFDFTSDVYSITASGAGRVQLTNGFGFYGSLLQYYLPSWSPDGGRLAAITCAAVSDPVYLCSALAVSVMNADGSGLATLVAANGFVPYDGIGLSWAPDGQALAYIAGNALRWVGAGGNGEGLIVNDATSPAWRP